MPRKPMYQFQIERELGDKLASHCKERGLIIKTLVEKLIEIYLRQEEEYESK